MTPNIISASQERTWQYWIIIFPIKLLLMLATFLIFILGIIKLSEIIK